VCKYLPLAEQSQRSRAYFDPFVKENAVRMHGAAAMGLDRQAQQVWASIRRLIACESSSVRSVKFTPNPHPGKVYATRPLIRSRAPSGIGMVNTTFSSLDMAIMLST
jgi:hypothetical protein